MHPRFHLVQPNPENKLVADTFAIVDGIDPANRCW